ncbi:MAG: aldo/keto reductase [Alphaproteobacteria bacterium]|nr:aldo/keto reductase [Alphaproteobacteria bacterium]
MLALSEPTKLRFAYGFWRYREDDLATARAVLSAARERGIDHLDTADVYGGAGGSERLLGELRRRAPSLFDGAVLATKAGVEPGVPYNSSRAYLTAACEASLGRLGVERIDLFYVHRPDLLTHPAELAATLDALVAAGKIANVGVSNFTVAEIEVLSRFMKSPIVAHQIEFSAMHVEPLFDGTLDQAMQRGIAVAAWSPLAGGRLAAPKSVSENRVFEVLQRLAAKAGVALEAMAVAFLRSHPAPVTPILGTTSVDRLHACLAAEAFALSRADWYSVVEACLGKRMP